VALSALFVSGFVVNYEMMLLIPVGADAEERRKTWLLRSVIFSLPLLTATVWSLAREVMRTECMVSDNACAVLRMMLQSSGATWPLSKCRPVDTCDLEAVQKQVSPI
jgi:hypothetical protein